ncbi:kelch-like protein 25 isoform X2 [Condylostylus longicornis]|uniref:kelch-like protein 25 isoform X2 n=1 Tax=Condylostylus longicornis TaxID=2530218 RepID=UPI00244DF231|nr:kelch-like protein 25 isoform X2 [Condylostylus longicornis]
MMHNEHEFEDFVLFEDDLHCTSKFKEQLNYFRTSNKFTDITVIALDGKSFMAHKVVLAASCPYFRQKLEEFIYSRKVHISKENACEIHRAASRYQFLDLAYKALEIMINNILPETSLRYWRYSTEKSIENLKQYCLEFVRADTEIFLEHHINSLFYEEIYQICSMRNLSCPIDVLYHYAINIWLKNDFLARRVYIRQLLSFFNINYLPYQFVEEEILTDQVLLQNEEFQKWKSVYKPRKFPN